MVKEVARIDKYELKALRFIKKISLEDNPDFLTTQHDNDTATSSNKIIFKCRGLNDE